jgi:hypothetical protein
MWQVEAGLKPVQIAGKSLVNLVKLSEYSDRTIGKWSDYINSGVGKFCIGKGVHVVKIIFVTLIRPSLYLNFTGLAKSGGGGWGGCGNETEGNQIKLIKSAMLALQEIH